ncbi:MBL fold metallo-hydrolase [Paenibacillus oceani]|jgi:phosphoribosyl 1,2-cyclic phosphodiesterase|uniref:MBL fold metallo-hydrolase n=1 Tax=Paenibacillus oceani TaxID=2772510 RepID=A0A927GY04_9BACL|nr:MBL fold metallo-hydrolase [Paenibacillus oceani]MBD2860688.1 MBL fold metallo-hydrolase [Paenibacillus oceani]MDF2661718.1 yycJ [Paenibacillus sp.]
MTLRYTVLASGSTGNSLLVDHEGTKVLVDAGLSAKKIEQLMEERGVRGSELDAILITHEHSDHIKGVGALARKHDLPVYANEKTWEALNKHLGALAEEKIKVMETGSVVEFGGLQVESYPISHDAAEPVGYCFHDGDTKLSLATDLGYVSSKVKEKIADSDAIILESNHDIEMLRMGKYPWNIKRRILGDTGHLSNEAAGEALCDILTGKTETVYLAHLSRDHNLMDLAKLTVNNILEERGIQADERKVELKDTYFDRATKWDRLGPDS